MPTSSLTAPLSCKMRRWLSDSFLIYFSTLSAAFLLGFLQEGLASFNADAAERYVPRAASLAASTNGDRPSSLVN